ncbi:MAG: type II toxin-antitoxin system RelE/ParE family toxin [Kiritimatiellales bacterium]|nr:type II toxin-antitoxin system RelE/ParE family toxin [Kiritimatiellales bacterium]
MRFEFAKAAREEFLDSIEYYELQQTGLGLIFSEQVLSTIEQIIEFPDGWTPLDKTFHRCLVKQFPYALIYTVLDRALIITAVMNLHRKPDYWRNR